jgi:hypothetical protein
MKTADRGTEEQPDAGRKNLPQHAAALALLHSCFGQGAPNGAV